MKAYLNPFEYEEANKFTEEQLLDYYIEDFNYSRFIHSKRNVFLVGERGTGKTMALLYHSLPVQKKKAEREKRELNLSIFPVYVPCNTPLTHRLEYELLDDLKASFSSEHFLVVSIMDAVVRTLAAIDGLFNTEEEENLRAELQYALNLDLPENVSLFRALELALRRASAEAQEALNRKELDPSFASLFSFSSGVHHLLACLGQTSKLRASHFSLMIDDAQLLNPYQIRALNSWIGYRDNSLFSFKVTTTRVEMPLLKTSSGGSILEGHDFSRIDMERHYQNRMSEFGRMARDIVMRRLRAVNIESTPEEFFPIHPQVEKAIEKARTETEVEARKKYPDGTEKQIRDHVYKYARAKYFRSRPSRSNLPPYSGFEVIVHLSTGVIRNLLDPCYWMYDLAYSKMHSNGQTDVALIDHIPPSDQNSVIKDRSRKKWEFARDSLDKSVDGCSRADAKHIYQLLDNIAIYFAKRLFDHKSEPRAVVFSISDYREDLEEKLGRILMLAQKAQLIYSYTSSGKDFAKRQIYYMPNRMLWPDRGLDPIGQHSRAWIRAEHLWNAAENNIEIPFKGDDEEDEQRQLDFSG